MSLTRLTYTQLAETDNAKPVEVLRTGTFTDKNGREVEITDADLDAFIANFTAGAAGQDVPIDIDHERAEAGGWVKRMERAGDKLLAWVDWNALGKQLVGDKVYKYLSATIDTVTKVIKSVSLVNFPAVKGLKAVELSEGVYAFQQVGFWDAIQDMIVGAIGKGSKPVELADGIPGSVTISQYLVSTMQQRIANCINDLALSGYLSQDEHKQILAALDSASEALSGGTGEAGSRVIPAPNYFMPYPPYAMSESRTPVNYRGQAGTLNSTSIVKTVQTQEVTKPMDPKELGALRQQIQTEERAKVEIELAERHRTEAELREKVKKELEVELEDKYKRRQGLVEFATQLTQGAAGLSAKPDDIVAFLEALPADQLETGKTLLLAKVVDFSEKGSSGEGKTKLPQLPGHARADVIAGELTIKDLFDHNVLPGKPEDYDLSEFNATQKGF